MPEPSTVTAASIAASLSAVSLALFGVDYYSLLYGLVGALFALGHSQQMGRARAVVYVVLSALGGAVIGNLAVLHFELKGGRIVLIGLCIVGGIVAQAVAAALLKAAPKVIETAAARWERGGRK